MAKLRNPRGVALDASGSLYVADNNRAVRKISWPSCLPNSIRIPIPNERNCTCLPGYFEIETTFEGHPFCVNTTHNYVVISTNGEILNLFEVDLYSNGVKLLGASLQFNISSVSSGVSACNDGMYGPSMCHSAYDPIMDTNAFLVIDAGAQSFDLVNVANRQDCCMNRINKGMVKTYRAGELETLDMFNRNYKVRL